jgi:UDP-glucose 4-epimerase
MKQIKKMRWAIIGANGFIGKNLIEYLLPISEKINLLDRSWENFPWDNSPILKKFTGTFQDKSDLEKVIQGCDLVINLASSSIPENSNNLIESDIQNNLIGNLNVFDVCTKEKIKRLLIPSSGGTVYGLNGASLLAEDDIGFPICSYGIVKQTIEKYAYLFSFLNQLPVTVLRISNPYGKYQGGKKQGVVAALLNAAILEQEFNLWGDGNTIRDYLYIQDLIEIIDLAANYEEKEKFNIYNIGSGIGYSINDLIKTVENITKKDIKIARRSPRNFDLPVNVLNIEKIKKKLGWKPKFNIEQGICEFYEWHIKNKQKN